MSSTPEQLCSMTCKPCEGGVEPMTSREAGEQLAALEGWLISEDGNAITKTLELGDFMSCVKRIDAIAEVAEANDHHPDLHLEGYRNLRILMTTHAIGGLSENDFIVAAKIDALGNSSGKITGRNESH